MKKIQLMLIGVIGLVASGTVSAAYPDLTEGNNDITMVDCSLLANDITVMLTSGVVGGVVCDDTNNIIGLSVCHSSGLTTDRTASTPRVDGACPSGYSAADDAAPCVKTVTGAGFPTATTARGTVASRYPGSTCDATNSGTQAQAAITEVLNAQ